MFFDYFLLLQSEPILHAEQDPEMARYLDRSYWDQKSKEETNKVPSAPSHVNNSSSPQPTSSAPVRNTLCNNQAVLLISTFNVELTQSVIVSEQSSYVKLFSSIFH